MFDEITTFSFPTRIVFGRGAVRRLPACLEETGVRKPLVVTDPGLRASPAFDAVTSVLKDAGISFEVFDSVHGNPVEDDVLESVELYHSAACDGVIGLGGGSAIDVAKAVVVKARHDGPLAELEAQAGGMDRMTGPYDPIIAVPTTAGTGSEVGRSSVITSHELGRKIIIFSPWLMPKARNPRSGADRQPAAVPHRGHRHGRVHALSGIAHLPVFQSLVRRHRDPRTGAGHPLSRARHARR